MEQVKEIAKTSQHEKVKHKILELIQAWAFAFRNAPKYRAVQVRSRWQLFVALYSIIVVVYKSNDWSVVLVDKQLQRPC